MCMDSLSSLSGFLGPVGDLVQGQQVASGLRESASQATGSNIQNMRQKAYAQGRRLGAQKAAIGKASLKMSGSANRLIEEQIRQDELEIETDKYNAVLDVKNYYNKAKQVQQKAMSSAVIKTGKLIAGMA